MVYVHSNLTLVMLQEDRIGASMCLSQSRQQAIWASEDPFTDSSLNVLKAVHILVYHSDFLITGITKQITPSDDNLISSCIWNHTFLFLYPYQIVTKIYRNYLMHYSMWESKYIHDPSTVMKKINWFWQLAMLALKSFVGLRESVCTLKGTFISAILCIPVIHLQSFVIGID